MWICTTPVKPVYNNPLRSSHTHALTHARTHAHTHTHAHAHTHVHTLTHTHTPTHTYTHTHAHTHARTHARTHTHTHTHPRTHTHTHTHTHTPTHAHTHTHTHTHGVFWVKGNFCCCFTLVTRLMYCMFTWTPDKDSSASLERIEAESSAFARLQSTFMGFADVTVSL